MRTNLTTLDREPLAVRAAITTAVTAVVHVAVVLGLPLTQDAEVAIGGAVDAVGLVALLLWARPSITPNAKVISRVTTDGTVVAGDAAVLPSGTELTVSDYATANAPAGAVEPVIVNPDLVATDA